MELLNTTKKKVLAAAAFILLVIIADKFFPEKPYNICEDYCLTKADAFKGLVVGATTRNSGRMNNPASFVIRTETKTIEIFEDVNLRFYKKIGIGDSVFKESGTLEAKIVHTPQIPSLSIFNREILKEFDSSKIKDCKCK